MGKHKKHHKGHGHSSSSSSSSSDSDDERKKYKKEQKRIKKMIKKGQLPPNYLAAGGAMAGAAAAYGASHHGSSSHHGSHGYPGQVPYPTGGVPPPSGPAGGYPPQTGYPGGQPGYGAPPANQGYPPPGAAPFNAPPPGGAGPFNAPPGGAPGPFSAPQSGYPQSSSSQPPAMPGYPGGTSYPAQPYGNTGYSGAPPPVAGGYPGGPPGGGYAGGVQPGGYPSTGPPGGYPGAAPGGYPSAAPTSMAPGGYGGGPPPPTGGYAGYGQTAAYDATKGQPAYSSQPGIPPQGAPPPASYSTPGVQQTTADMGKMKIYGTLEQFRGTVVSMSPFSAESDAEIIRKAMKGMGTDEQAIIDLISRRSNEQRQQIKKMFKTMYGKDLIQDLKSELSGDFKESIMALFMPTTYFDAWTLNQAMVGLGTKESVLIEILCTRTNAEIHEILSSYKEHYRRDLEKDIVNDTSGHFKRLLVSCCQGNRAELTDVQWQQVNSKGPESVVDRALAQKDAQELYQAGEKKMGTDESVFLKIMAIRHFYQLRATFEEYAKISQRDILGTISREMSGDLEEGFKALVMSARNRPEYFADKLYRAMKGAGTDDSSLIRIVVSRSEIDMVNIKQIFMNKYQKSLSKMISGDTSGDYKRLIVTLVGRD